MRTGSRSPQPRTQLLSESIWTTIDKEWRKHGRKRLAVAYVTQLRRARLKKGDVVITDASDAMIRAGQTNAAVLLELHKKDVAIFSRPRLHAKVLILPDCVVVGSANLSGSAQTLREAALLDRSPQVRKEVIQWFARVKNEAVKLSRSDLIRLSKIPVVRTGGIPPQHQPTLLEAVEAQSPILKDFVFSWYMWDAKLPEGKVAKSGRQKRFLPADMTQKDWTWSEWEDKPGLSAELRAAFSSKPDIAFVGRTDLDGQLNGFAGVDINSLVYLGSTRIVYRGSVHRVVFDRVLHGIPAIRTSGQWRRELCRILTVGLRARPRIARAIDNRRSSTIKVSELYALFRAGKLGV